MAELATIARPYAKALFELADEKKRTDSWLDGLKNLTWIVQQPTVGELINDSNLTAFDKTEKLIHLLLDNPVSRDMEFKNFIQIVATEKRLNLIPEIYTQYQDFTLAQHETTKAIVYSAYPMGEGQFAKVLADCQHRFGRRLDATLEVVPELIGGVKVEVGDQVLDMSVQGKLKKLYTAMIN